MINWANPGDRPALETLKLSAGADREKNLQQNSLSFCDPDQSEEDKFTAMLQNQSSLAAGKKSVGVKFLLAKMQPAPFSQVVVPCTDNHKAPQSRSSERELDLEICIDSEDMEKKHFGLKRSTWQAADSSAEHTSE